MPRLTVTRLYDFAEAAAAFAARYPGAEVYSDDEVFEFSSAADWIDQVSPKRVVKAMTKAGITIPAALQADTYRMGRYIFHRWNDPEVKQGLLAAVVYDLSGMARLKRKASPEVFRTFFDAVGPMSAMWALKRSGLADLIPAVTDALTAEQANRLRGTITFVRALLHRYVTQPEHLERQPSRGEQREMIRRLARRALRLRSMRRSLYGLNRERKALIGRIRGAERVAEAEIAALGAALEQTRRELAAAEISHAAALTEQSQRHAAELALLEAQTAAAMQDFTAALAERQAWAAVVQLHGEVVAVVGDTAREAGYRALVESAGGRFVQVSAVEKLNRVPEAVAGADVVILIAACATHQSERMLRKAARPEALLLRCPQAGLAAFERVLRTEVLLRQGVGGAATPSGR